MHVRIGVFPQLLDVRLQPIVHGVADLLRRPRTPPAGGVGDGNGEFVAIGQRAGHHLTVAQRDTDGRRPRRRAGPSSARSGIQHPLQQRQSFVTSGDALQIAFGRMAARARRVEVALPRRRIARLQIGQIHRAAPPGGCRGLGPLIVDEGDKRRHVGVPQREGRHALVGTAAAQQRRNLVAAHVAGDECRAGEVGAPLAARGIAAVTEAALRGKPRAPGLDLLARKALLRRRRRRPDRGRTGLPAPLRRGVGRERHCRQDRRAPNSDSSHLAASIICPGRIGQVQARSPALSPGP